MMAEMAEMAMVSSSFVFVTGSTGLLGNNVVQLALERGLHVKALVRSMKKGQQQFGSPLPQHLELIEGDLEDSKQFEASMRGCTTVIHCAAYFRDSLKGGKHWLALHKANVEGTRNLLQCSYAAGVKKFINISTIGVFFGAENQVLDEKCFRDMSDCPDDYYRSKIMQDQEVKSFLDSHPDFFACNIAPGWMHGPGDLGPTSAGQTVIDFCQSKLPGIPKATFAVVDARDVALGVLNSIDRGKRGEHYIIAGPQMSFEEVYRTLEKVSGVKSPTMKVPLGLMYTLASFMELGHYFNKKPVLISLATVRLMAHEYNRVKFDCSKAKKQLGVSFRSVDETFLDEINYFKKIKMI